MKDHEMECFCFLVDGDEGKVMFNIPTDGKMTNDDRIVTSNKLKIIIADERGISTNCIKLVCNNKNKK